MVPTTASRVVVAVVVVVVVVATSVIIDSEAWLVCAGAYALCCQLDGRAFAGTALQPQLRTVHGVLRQALAKLHHQEVPLVMSCSAVVQSLRFWS